MQGAKAPAATKRSADAVTELALTSGKSRLHDMDKTGCFHRRKFIAAAAATGFGISTAYAQSQPYLKTIPASGEKIPAIGMGSWLTFNVGADRAARAQRSDVLRTFFENGGAVIDSSPMYGSSQAVIGHALAQIQSAKPFAADKVWVNGGDNGPTQIAQTSRRWGIEKFDLLQVHNLVSWQAHLETLFQMKAHNRLRYVGVTSYSGLRYNTIEQIMHDHPLDFIQITYNLADREAENRLLPLAREKGIAVIANRPFREGALINAVMRRPLPDHAKEIDAENWAQYLLKFIISHPAMTVAIPATRRVDHMRENMGALLGAMPDEKFRRTMINTFESL